MGEIQIDKNRTCKAIIHYPIIQSTFRFPAAENQYLKTERVEIVELEEVTGIDTNLRPKP